MAITYTKYITSLGCYTQIDGQQDVVFTISWQLGGADGVFNNIVLCNTSVPYVAGQPFTPYADLTEAQVMAWIDQYTPPEQMAIWEENVANNIAVQKEIQYPPLPWQPPLAL